MRVFLFLLVLSSASTVLSADKKADTFIEAARKGQLEVVKRMLEEGIDVNVRPKFDITALWQAAGKGHGDVVKVLLEAGADPNINDNTWKVTPLLLSEKPKIVGLLLKKGAKGAGVKLRNAAMLGQSKMVQTILESTKIEEAWYVSAKAHAKLAKKKKIVELLEKAFGKAIPDPPTISEEILKTYAGNFINERLERVKVSVKEGQLRLGTAEGPSAPLIPRGNHIFERGIGAFEFQMKNGKVVGFLLRDIYVRRSYVRDNSTNVAENDSHTKHAPGNEEIDNAIAAKENWSSFRGPGARGIAVGQNLPEKWDVAKGQGVLWKTPITGLAHSAPVIWKDRVFLTTATSKKANYNIRIGLYGAGSAQPDDSIHEWKLLCLDAKTGKRLWTKVAKKGKPPVKRHLKSTQANPTPATDGKNIVAVFNSGGLYCYDFKGTLKWEKNLGVLDSGAFNSPDDQWGFASSPIIYRKVVIVQIDIQKGSYVAAYDLRDGRELWKTPREESPSWGTPTVYETDKFPLLITNATNYIRGYDARNGKEIWRLNRNASITVPTPFVAHQLIYVTSGYRPVQPIYAIRLDAVGDISLSQGTTSSKHVAWSRFRGGPYLPTPIVYGNYLFTCANNGVFTCYNAKTGKRIYRRRVGHGNASSFTASIVAADGKIFLTAEAGVIYEIQSGPQFKLLSEHHIGEYTLATPAIAGGRFFVRTNKHLIAFGSKPKLASSKRNTDEEEK